MINEEHAVYESTVDPTESEPTLGARVKRVAVRIGFLGVALVLVLDTLPWWNIVYVPKLYELYVAEPIGLWQGEWTLFAPNPFLDNGWMSADLRDQNGNRYVWNSPHWVEKGIVEKFTKFRHLNYYNRIYSINNRIAADDLADNLARRPFDLQPGFNDPLKLFGEPPPPAEPGPIVEVKLFHVSKTMSLAPDSPLPRKDDILWILRTEYLTTRNVEP